MADRTTIYTHTQPGFVLRWALGVSSLLLVAVWIVGEDASGAVPPGVRLVQGGVLLLILAALALTYSLTVTVDDSQVSATLGPGVIRHSIPLEQIGSARVVRHGWYWGYGLRVTTRGLLWRVSGLNAVELALTKGRFSIGTDDPQGLLQAVERALDSRASSAR